MTAPEWKQEPSNKPLVLSEQCSTCVGRPGNPMHLRSGRLRALVRENLDAGALLTCHQTTYGQTEQEAACRWFLDQYGPQVNVVRVMERLAAMLGEASWFQEVPPPAKEEA